MPALRGCCGLNEREIIMSDLLSVCCGWPPHPDGYMEKEMMGLCQRCNNWSGFEQWRQSDGCGCVYYDAPEGIRHDPCEKHKKETF